MKEKIFIFLFCVLSSNLFARSASSSSRSFSSSSSRSSSRPSSSYSRTASKPTSYSSSNSKTSTTPSRTYTPSKSSWFSGSKPSQTSTPKSPVEPSSWFKRKTPETIRPVYQPKFSSPSTLDEKRRSFYGPQYHTQTPIVVTQYRDSFNPWFWMWLMSQSSSDKAAWAHNHKDEIDPARLQELKSKDASFEERLKALEGTPKDPKYKPTGIDDDLMYTEEKSKSNNIVGWLLLGIPVIIISILAFIKFRG